MTDDIQEHRVQGTGSAPSSSTGGTRPHCGTSAALWGKGIYTVKKVSNFSVPSRNVTSLFYSALVRVAIKRKWILVVARNDLFLLYMFNIEALNVLTFKWVSLSIYKSHTSVCAAYYFCPTIPKQKAQQSLLAWPKWEKRYQRKVKQCAHMY